LGLLTYATRLSFILVLGQMDVPLLIRRAMRLVPPAVLSALIVPDLLVSNGALTLSLTNPRLVAGVVAVGIAWRTKNIFWTVGVGMVVLLGLQSIFR
jgi:branched-subunit amino acid transport protein